LHYVNAGHNFPYRALPENQTVEPLSVGGLPLGMFEMAEYQAASVTLRSEETVVLYTDGVTEAMDKGQNEYSEKRLQDVIISQASHSAQEMKQAILSDVQRFVADEPQSDDLTLMVLKRVE
jgi:sigma-B regulation protein RsbU (phosphoserine phosphatase)